MPNVHNRGPEEDRYRNIPDVHSRGPERDRYRNIPGVHAAVILKRTAIVTYGV